MKLIIEIPEEVYKCVQDGSYCGSLYKELKAAIPYNPTGDLISRKQVLDELMAHQYSQDFCKEHGIEYSINSSMVRIIVNGAQTVEAYPFEQVQELVKLNQQFAQEIENLKRPQGEYESTSSQTKWVKIFENPYTNGYKCPFCGHRIQVTEKFLPQVTECEACGADMRGGAE